MSELTSALEAKSLPSQESPQAAPRARKRSGFRALVGLRGKLVASYLSATLVLWVGLASFVQMQLAEDTAELADRRRSILRASMEIERAILAAETAQRAYLLTREERSLGADGNPLRPPLEHQLDELTRLGAEYPSYSALANRIARNARLKLAEIDQTVAAVRAGGEGLTVFERSQGAALTAAIRADVAELVTGVRAMRDAEAKRADVLTSFAKWCIVIGNLVAFCLTAAVTFWIGKAFTQAERATESMADYSKRLEDHANRLAAQEHQLGLRLAQERELSYHLERSNQALERSNADLEQFAYVASHDLRAPLRGIASLSDWLEEDLGSAVTPEVKKHIDTLRGRVSRLDALITGIATYSRAGQRDEMIEQVDVARIVRDVIDLTVPSGSVQVSVDTLLPVIAAPRTPLQQIFLNLVSNAVKHGAPQGGTIVISHTEDSAMWRFSVTDHGPGIPPEYHEKIFGLFQRLKSRDQVEGTGIGLALVKKLVERHGGRVWVESSAGHGTTFAFTWPKRIVD